MRKLCAIAGALLVAILTSGSVAGQTNAKLVVYGDIVYFFGQRPPVNPLNCVMNSRFKRGDPVGFRASAINPETGKRDRTSQLVVHLSYGGRTVDVPMRDRQTEQQPERDFFVAKWMVPDDAPLGVVRYTITAKDPQGRTGEFKPFDVLSSQITIVE